MKLCRIFLVLLLSLQIANGVAQTRLKRFEIIPQATPITSLQVEHADCAVLIVHSAISGLKFESNMGKIKAQNYLPLESRYVVYLYPEKQKVAVKCPGYVESEFPIFSNLKARQQFSYEINEAFDTVSKGDFTLLSDPAGAEITIEQIPVFKEMTPYVFKQFGASIYSIRLSKERYETYTANITIETDKAKTQTCKLIPLWADLTITSVPSGSSVFLNNVLKGTTPLALTGVSNGLNAGSYDLRIEPASQYYESFSQKIVLAGNTAQEINHPHTDISGYIRVNAAPQPLEVRINGTIDKTLAMGEKLRAIKGDYRIEIRNVGENSRYYAPCSESFQLKALENKLISVVLEDKSGTISVSPSHQPAQIYLDGKLDNELNENHSKRLIAGNYKLKAIFTGEHKSAFDPIEKDVQLNAADNLNIPINFSPRQYRLLVDANVPDYQLSLRDLETGKSTVFSATQQLPLLYAGAYQISATKPGYRIINQDVRLIDKDISIHLQLEELNKIYQSKIGTWKVHKYSAAAVFIASCAASAYFGYSSLQNYDDYQKATTTSSAMDYRAKAIDNRNLAYGTMGVDILGGSWMLYSYIKQHHWQKKLQADMGRK